MATRGKSSKQREKVSNSTFAVPSVDSTVREEKVLDQSEEEEEDEDQPVVFVCGKCKLPVGDSMSWDGSENEQNQIRLKRVTDNVCVGKKNRMYEVSKRSLCLVVDLSCQGCNTVLGMVYVSTPKNLDHKRFAFCLNVRDIDSYVFGSARQMVAAGGADEQPVTLEYRSVVEQQLTEMKMLVMSMVVRMEEIEVGLQEGYEEP